MNNFNMFIRQCVLYKRNLFPIWKKKKKQKNQNQHTKTKQKKAEGNSLLREV